MIEIRGLTKRYGRLTAVDNLWLTVERGDAMGFIGPNGAGKTTTIRMLATLLQPDGGTATVAGHDVFADAAAVRAAIGYLPENAPAYADMRVAEYLKFRGRLRRMGRLHLRRRLHEVIRATDLVMRATEGEWFILSPQTDRDGLTALRRLLESLTVATEQADGQRLEIGCADVAAEELKDLAIGARVLLAELQGRTV